MSAKEFKNFMKGFLISVWMGFILACIFFPSRILIPIVMINILLTIYGILLIKEYGN